jgi:hypothetical protein
MLSMAFPWIQDGAHFAVHHNRNVSGDEWK